MVMKRQDHLAVLQALAVLGEAAGVNKPQVVETPKP